MRDLDGKVAVVTGGGSGIGRGTVLALAEAGMRVVVADLDEPSAKEVADEVGGLAVRVDVADRASVDALADAAFDAFGAVHVVHNNAGVAIFGPMAELTHEDWTWIRSINLDGVVHGIQAFVPRMQQVEGPKHIVNTASMAGMVAYPSLGAYNATKFAVVAISEVLREELKADGFGVSVLCPGVVATNIMQNSNRDRPGGAPPMPGISDLSAPSGLRIVQPEDVGRMVRAAIESDEPYIFTHPEYDAAVEMRFDGIKASFDRAKAIG